jgi:hypothetical protein
VFKREICGADVRGEFDRTQFGLTKAAEGDPTVRLIIQVEAIKGDTLPSMPPIPAGGPPGATSPPPDGAKSTK